MKVFCIKAHRYYIYEPIFDPSNESSPTTKKDNEEDGNEAPDRP